MSAPATTTFTVRGRRIGELAFAVARTWIQGAVGSAPLGSPAWRRVVESSAARMLRAVAVDVEVLGAHPLVVGPAMLVANHVSWLDVQALGAIAGARFVAKSEVRGWPAVGDMAARLGTIFIVRGSRLDAWRVQKSLAKLLVNGERVVVFPEGTTTDGSRVATFYPALLQAAVDAAVPVQPVAVRYREADGSPSTAAAFVDDMTFGESLVRVIARPRLVAELTFGPPIYAGDRTRRELAARCRRFITQTLGYDDQPVVAPRPGPLRRAA